MAISEEGRTSPNLFRQFNLAKVPARVRQTFFGKIRTLNTFTVLEWIYLVLSFIALTTSLGITIQRLAVEDPADSDFTFAILLLLTIGFCYLYVIRAIFTERWTEVIVFIVSNAIVLIYCVLNYFENPNDQATVKLVRLIIVCILSPLLIIMGLIQSIKYCKSNHLVHDAVGGSTELQKACGLFFICTSLLIFDLQLQLSMVILVMGQGVISMTLTQKVILASGIPVSILVVMFGYFGLRHENKLLMIAFYIFSLFEPAYVIYKLIYNAKHGEKDEATFRSTFACGYFALVIWIMLISSTGYFIVFYFGKGLRQKMFGDPDVPSVQPKNTVSIEEPLEESDALRANVE